VEICLCLLSACQPTVLLQNVCVKTSLLYRSCIHHCATLQVSSWDAAKKILRTLY
jgi:hypothetical protein